MNHCGTIKLETDRLILRRFNVDDAASVFKNWASDDEVTKYLTWSTHQSIDVSREYIDFCMKQYANLSFYQWGILDLPSSMIQVPEGQEWIIEMINNILIEVLSSMAEQERLTIRKRQRQGIDAAKAKGKHLGRPFIQKPNNYEQRMELWYAKKITTFEDNRLQFR